LQFEPLLPDRHGPSLKDARQPGRNVGFVVCQVVGFAGIGGHIIQLDLGQPKLPGFVIVYVVKPASSRPGAAAELPLPFAQREHSVLRVMYQRFANRFIDRAAF